MSIFRRSGLVHKPSGILHAIFEELKVVDLRPVTRIDFKFDPFQQGAKDVRSLMYFLSAPRIRDTNFKCSFKSNVVSDASEPEIRCKLENGKVIHFKAANLTLLEILQQFNKILKPLIPPPDDAAASVPKTKSQKRK